MYDYYADVLAIVDGDTIDVRRDAGGDLWQVMRIRFNFINAPEKNTPEGKQAKDWLIRLLTNPDGTFKPIYLFTVKDKKEKYGRYLGHFWIWGEDPAKLPSVNDRMVKAGQAKYQTY